MNMDSLIANRSNAVNSLHAEFGTFTSIIGIPITVYLLIPLHSQLSKGICSSAYSIIITNHSVTSVFPLFGTIHYSWLLTASWQLASSDVKMTPNRMLMDET